MEHGESHPWPCSDDWHRHATAIRAHSTSSPSTPPSRPLAAPPTRPPRTSCGTGGVRLREQPPREPGRHPRHELRAVGERGGHPAHARRTRCAGSTWARPSSWRPAEPSCCTASRRCTTPDQALTPDRGGARASGSAPAAAACRSETGGVEHGDAGQQRAPVNASPATASTGSSPRAWAPARLSRPCAGSVASGRSSRYTAVSRPPDARETGRHPESCPTLRERRGGLPPARAAPN